MSKNLFKNPKSLIWGLLKIKKQIKTNKSHTFLFQNGKKKGIKMIRFKQNHNPAV